MTHFTKIVLFSAVMSLSLGGCATVNREVGLASNIEVADMVALPVPSTPAPYTVKGQQQLEIVVTDSERLSGTFVTDPEGYMAYPLLGELPVAGKTPNEIARMIADGLRGQYVLNPQVRVRPTLLPVPSISVGGQVKSPGTIAAAISPTLIRAINNAGGLAEYGKSDDVLIMRTVDGQQYIGVYNIAAIQRGNYRDPEIYSNDIITVGDSPERRRLEQIIQFIPLLSTAAILYNTVQK